MLAAYQSGDPYLTFAKQAGRVPPDGTMSSHGAIREQFKACALGVQYGMGAESLAVRIGCNPIRGRELLALHHETYSTCRRWSDAAVCHAYLHGELKTTFGWIMHLGPDTNSRTLRNFTMQANGAEMLRLACCLTTEQGVRVCAPVHDALLIEASADEIDAAVVTAQAAMAAASRIVLGGVLTLRSEAKIFRAPERFLEERGRSMWELVQAVLGEITAEQGGHQRPGR
jgi:DNA polymerase I-like protein with 3'-5' exonuclease and polymerase domains